MIVAGFAFGKDFDCRWASICFGGFDLFDCRAFWRSPASALFVDSGAAAVAFDVHFENRRMVDETVDGCERHGWITKQDRMPLLSRG